MNGMADPTEQIDDGLLHRFALQMRERTGSQGVMVVLVRHDGLAEVACAVEGDTMEGFPKMLRELADKLEHGEGERPLPN